MALVQSFRKVYSRLIEYKVKTYVDNAAQNAEIQIVAIDPGTTVSSVPSIPSTAGNMITSGAVSAATVDAAGLGGVKLIDYTTNSILSVNIFNRFTSVCEISFDGGSTWLELQSGFSPSFDFANKGRVLTSDVYVRKQGATTVTGGAMVAWGMI
jgi:hypothetical protein